MKPMTIRGYAAHRKCSRQAVEKALAAGRITAIEGPRGRLIDPVAADKAWRDNTDPLRGGPLSKWDGGSNATDTAALPVPAEQMDPDTMVRLGDVLEQLAKRDAADDADMTERVRTALETLVDEMIEVSVKPGADGVRVISADLARALMAPAADERVEADPDPIRQVMRAWIACRVIDRIDVMVQLPEPAAA